MLARYANVRNFDRVLKTWEWMGAHFGASGEFTAKEFNNVKKDYPARMFCSLKFLEEEGIIKLIRVDTLTKEIAVDPWKAEEWLIDKNGNYVTTCSDWCNLPQVAQTALVAMNGQDFRIERKETEIVKSEKFTYAPNPDGMWYWRRKYCAL